MNLLLLSSSKLAGTNYLEHAQSLINSHLNNQVKKALFIPYAGVTISYDQYLQMVSTAFNGFGYEVESIHQHKDPINAVNSAETILVGGGNTFCLLNKLYENNLISSIQQKVKSGTPYIGWSAGSNIAAPSICTTNDMPIVEPPSFKALNLLSCQINPHYLDGNPPGHQGETREQRINEFLVQNPDLSVVGIPEGTALKSSGTQLTYVGHKNGFLFSHGKDKQIITHNTNLSQFLAEE